MMDRPYTLGMWRVKKGLEEEFVHTWRELGAYFDSLPNPPGAEGTLVQSLEDAQVFYSFGPWQRFEDIQAMRANPKTPAMIGKLMALCDEAKPGNYRLVASSAPGESGS